MRSYCAALPIFVVCVVASSTASGHEFRSAPSKFEAALSGAQEVTGTTPQGVITDARGRVAIRFDTGLQSAHFRLVVRDGVDVTQAHLHCARAGINGPIVSFLFPLQLDPGVDVDGLLAEGTLDNENILAKTAEECGVVINNIASLLGATLDGIIYANVHTVTNKGGEVRGQFFAIPDNED